GIYRRTRIRAWSSLLSVLRTGTPPTATTPSTAGTRRNRPPASRCSTAQFNGLPLTFSGGNPNANGTLWHDRAVYHFLTTPADRARYREVLLQAIRPGSRIIMATFASDGPTHCSGLPAAGYDSDGLV